MRSTTLTMADVVKSSVATLATSWNRRTLAALASSRPDDDACMAPISPASRATRTTRRARRILNQRRSRDDPRTATPDVPPVRASSRRGGKTARASSTFHRDSIMRVLEEAFCFVGVGWGVWG